MGPSRGLEVVGRQRRRRVAGSPTPGETGVHAVARGVCPPIERPDTTTVAPSGAVSEGWAASVGADVRPDARWRGRRRATLRASPLGGATTLYARRFAIPEVNR